MAVAQLVRLLRDQTIEALHVELGASLIVRRLPEMRLGLFASAAYLGNRDRAAIDLRREHLLVYDDSYGRLPELEWLYGQGLGGAIALRTASTRALLTAAVAGAGVALLAAPIAARADSLVELATAQAPPRRTPWLIVHRDLQRQPSVRLVHRWIVAAFDAVARKGRAA